MPRPGPRSYECVRRAWHGDTHQPIRGSLIQEIFRIANEIHGPAVRKNREWQEKLPVVVLKAEEIMYSKANSEAEYVKFDTIWERANDAIDTIIRRDETAETGELLLPCIEAALHLGCIPRKSSRSERNNSPRFYLNPEHIEPKSKPSSNVDDQLPRDYAANCLFMPRSLHLLSRTDPMLSSSYFMNPEKTSVMIQDNTNAYLKTPVSTSVIHQCHSSNSRSVYPLYYGNQFPSENSESKPHSHLLEADKRRVKAKHSSCRPNIVSGANIQPTPSGNGCDLSLRLGPLNPSCLNITTGNSWPQDVSSFPRTSSCDMIDLFPTKGNCKGLTLNVETALRKRKIGTSIPSEGQNFCWPHKLQFQHFNPWITNTRP